MRNQNCLTAHQNKFLIACRENPAVLEKMLQPMGLTLKRLFKWMRRLYFRQALSGVKTEMKRMTRLDLAVMARPAVQTLGKALAGDASVTEMQRDTSAMILQIYFTVFPTRCRSKPRIAEEPAKYSSRLVHPDVSDEEAKVLLDRMIAAEQRAAARAAATSSQAA